MNPISNTAIYTCVARAADATLPQSIGKDSYARLFLNEQARQVAAQMTAPPRETIGIVVRHRIIDDLLREQLALHPDTAVVILGCGFDSRAFRLPAGRWYEIDEPHIIELKNASLPAAGCAHALTRIGIRFAEQALAPCLPALARETPVVVVMEGIFYYLDEQQIEATLQALRQAYPGHRLVCDLLSHTVASRYSRRTRADLEKLGGKWLYTPDHPAGIFEKSGYVERRRISTADEILKAEKRSRMTHFLVRLLMPGLMEGACVHVFDSA